MLLVNASASETLYILYTFHGKGAKGCSKNAHLHMLEYSQAEVCSGTVAEVIQSVVNGADGCIFCFGHANLGQCYCIFSL